jgi:hypothetical protein
MADVDAHSDKLRSESDAHSDKLHADLASWLAGCGETFSAICLDVDNGPEWMVSDSKAGLYRDSGMDLLASRLVPGGVLAVWSAAASEAFTAALRAHFSQVDVLLVPVPRGEPDVVFLATQASML